MQMIAMNKSIRERCQSSAYTKARGVWSHRSSIDLIHGGGVLTLYTVCILKVVLWRMGDILLTPCVLSEISDTKRLTNLTEMRMILDLTWEKRYVAECETLVAEDKVMGRLV